MCAPAVATTSGVVSRTHRNSRPAGAVPGVMSETAATLTRSLPNEVEDLAGQVLTLACDKKKSIATAESCTGGLFASLLTDVEGRSHAFERGYVTYTEDAKHEELGVPRELLEAHGAVSEPCARAMAEGALKASGADVAISVTGFAGDGDEPGLVHLAVASRAGGVEHECHHFGDVGRGSVRVEALRAGLRMLLRALS